MSGLELIERMKAEGIPCEFVVLSCHNEIPARVNEMMMQSHEGVIRVFPSWPRGNHGNYGKWNPKKVPGRYPDHSRYSCGR